VALVEYNVTDRTAVIRLNRPERLNAMSADMKDELIDAFRRFNADEDVWVGILTGTGRGFCAGRDLKAQADGYAQGGGRLSGRQYTPESNMFGLSDTEKPLIAAVNGFAIGLGWYMVVDCDIRIAVEGARFAMTEVPTGVLGPYWMPATEGVPWPIGVEMAILGEQISAERLHAMGLLNAVVPADDLMAHAQAWADKFLGLPPVHVREVKGLMRSMRTVPGRDLLARELESRGRLASLEDSREAVLAWNEKRTPRFTGR
jgi:enoyl-CoA hydratase/carnithine racemase